MNNFSNFLRLGFEHITSLDALDHILFVVVLVAVYQTKNWLKMLVAVSFFTLGHTLTLTLGTFDVVTVDRKLIEFIIPLTILLTALFNLTGSGQNQRSKAKYWLAVLFGLIHGFGFSGAFEMLVLGEGSFWAALLPFTLGVELGQLVVVFIALTLMVLVQQVFRAKPRDWNLFVSGIGFGVAALMCIEQWPF